MDLVQIRSVDVQEVPGTQRDYMRQDMDSDP